MKTLGEYLSKKNYQIQEPENLEVIVERALHVSFTF